MVRRPKNWGNIRGGEEDERVPSHGLVPRGYDNMGPFNEVIIGPAGRNAADVEARDHDLQYGEEEAIGVKPHLQWVDADEEFLQDLQPTNWKENLAQGLFSVKKAAKNKGLVRDMSSKAKKWENDPRHKKAISQFERLRKEQETEVGDKRPREVVLDANGGVLKRMRGWQKEHKNNAFDAAASAEAARARNMAMNVTMGMHNDDPLPDLPDSGDMDVAMGGEEAEEATALRAGGGGPGPQISKETPISSYPSISYGLQETHTTILPYVTWCTLAIDKNATAPIQLKVRLNSIYDMLDIAIISPPADDTIFSGPGFTNKKVGFNGRSPISGNGYPVVPSLGTSAAERPQWRDYWAQIYQYYTVLGCEYEIIHVNPIGNHDTINGTPGNRVYGGDIICAEQIDTYSDTAAATGNVMPLTRLEEVMNYKNIKWHKIEANGHGNNFGNTLIVKGRYTPGQEKRNIVNDGDVKTWTAVGSQPNLKEFLTLNYWPHPLSAGTAFGANMQIRLKYIVQYKDLVAQARYPNTLNSTGNVQQEIRNADLAAQTLSDTVRQKTG